MSAQDEPVELEIPLVEIPARPEPPAVVPSAQYLTAPRPRPSNPAVTTRDMKAVGLGALIVGLVATLAWFARPPAAGAS